MKKVIVIFAAIVMIAGFSNRVFAQGSTVTGTTADAKLVTPITLTQTEVLNFGTMSKLTAADGTCILSTTNVRTPGGSIQLSAVAPTSKNAAYSVTGDVSTAYTIYLPTSITVSNGGNSMIINALTARSAHNAGVDGTVTATSPAGTDTFTIGGTLNVLAASPTGVYTGTFNVRVDYN